MTLTEHRDTGSALLAFQVMIAVQLTLIQVLEVSYLGETILDSGKLVGMLS